jgi:hypothetical protein
MMQAAAIHTSAEEWPDGDALKRFGVFVTDVGGNPRDLEGRYDTYDEVMGHCWRWDKTYLIEVDGKTILWQEFVKRYDLSTHHPK